MKRVSWKPVSVAAAFGVLAALLTHSAFRNRDLLVEWSWAKPRGAFRSAVAPELVAAAKDFAEARRPGEICLARALGADDRFLFLALGCGFFAEASSAEAPVLRPVRASYSAARISGLEEPDPRALENSVRRLFPLEAYRVYRAGFARSELLAELSARLRQRGRAR